MRLAGILLLFVFGLSLQAQRGPQDFYYWVTFKDKGQKEQLLSDPLNFLSERAIDRRDRQNISITSEDLPIDSAYVDSLKSLAEVHLYGASRWFNSALVFTNNTEFEGKLLNQDYIQSYKALSTQQATFIGELFSADTELEIVEGRDSTFYGGGFDQIHQINGHPLHDEGFEGQGMLIGVLDAGFRNADSMDVFAKMFEEGRYIDGWDFVDKDSINFESHTHGTHVLSAMASNLPGTLVGTAPKASYALYRTEDGSKETILEEYNWLFAIERADLIGCDVINSSLGYTTFDDSLSNHSYEDMNGNTAMITNAADKAASKGILVVNSAGNSGSNPWKYIGAPADGDSVMAIGAVNRDGVIAGFSSHGPSFDGRVKPNVSGLGEGTTLANTNNDGTFNANGTSFSSPVIAGMSACLWQALNHLNNMELMDWIQKSASHYENPDTLYGYGIPNYGWIFDILSFNDLSEQQSVWLFPSDVRGQKIYLKSIVADRDSRLEIVDLSGKIVFRESIQSGTHPLYPIHLSADLREGIYLANYYTTKGKRVAKILIH